MRKYSLLLLLIVVGFMSGCKEKNFPNCSEDYIQVEESCILKEINELYDFETMNTQYNMEIDLDVDTGVMDVEVTIGYKNTEIEADSFYLMFYANAVKRDQVDNVVISSLKVNREDAQYEINFDTERYLVTPQEAIEKDEFFEIEVVYSFALWDDGRLAKMDDYINAMFFYPVVAKYDGTWHNSEHSFMGEVLYTDIADFDVEITLDKDYLVASGGTLMDKTVNGDNQVLTYYLPDARDYSFSASDDYYYYETIVNDRTYIIYSLKYLSLSEQNYHFGYIVDTFDYLEEHIGPYYYDYFTLELGNIYGMESSSIVYCSQNIGEITVIHEIVHQWFYSMIGNNQAEESWLDEGVTSYVTGLVFEEIFGEAAAQEHYYSRYDAMNPDLMDRYTFSEGKNVIQHVDDYVDYGYIVYRYGSSVIYEYVERYLESHQQMLDALSVYYDEYNGLNASIEEFISLLEEETGVEETSTWFSDKLESVQRLDN